LRRCRFQLANQFLRPVIAAEPMQQLSQFQSDSRGGVPPVEFFEIRQRLLIFPRAIERARVACQQTVIPQALAVGDAVIPRGLLIVLLLQKHIGVLSNDGGVPLKSRQDLFVLLDGSFEVPGSLHGACVGKPSLPIGRQCGSRLVERHQGSLVLSGGEQVQAVTKIDRGIAGAIPSVKFFEIGQRLLIFPCAFE
jgi:hypothetical protein